MSIRNKFLLFLLLLAFSINAGSKSIMGSASSPTIDINPSRKAQTIDGWGVSLCWWAYQCGQWDEAKIDSLVDWLTSPEGLDYNIFRYNIGGGDDPQNRHCDLHHMGNATGKGLRAEMPGFKRDAFSPYDWQADSAQLKILRKIHERRSDAIFEAFSNSAPWYMTYSGCCGGADDRLADNLRPEFYGDFAQYLIDVCVHIRDTYGIEFRSLEPFNEPQTDYWYRNGSQEGCHFDVTSQVAFLKVLAPMLKDSGLHTVIAASDETSVAQSIKALTHYGDAVKLIGQWNTHSYMGTIVEKKRLSQLAESKHLRLWQSETGNGGRGIHGNLRMLQRLFDDMRYLKPVAWCDWQYFGEHDSQWCLVNGDHPKQECYRTKHYYVRQQVSRFIKQGYVILDTDDDQTLAAVSPDGKTTVIVALNNTSHARTFIYNVAGTAADIYTTDRKQNMVHTAEGMHHGKISVTLQPQSVKTIVVKL